MLHCADFWHKWHLILCTPAYHCGYLNWVIGIVVAMRLSKRPPADLAIHYNTLRAAKEQPDVTSYIPCIPSLACNWSIYFFFFGIISKGVQTSIQNPPP